MKRASFWLLIIGLLYVTFSEVASYSTEYTQRSSNHVSVANLVWVSAARGTTKKIDLPDGSSIQLNAASTLAYPGDIASGDRRVELYGEALFDISPNADHPFSVRAREMNIEVLGTRFNVRNYPDETFFQAVVNEGSIRVSYHDDTAILHARDAVCIDPDKPSDRVFQVQRRIDPNTITNWTTGIFSFSDIDLPSMLRVLSRSYAVDIEFHGSSVSHPFEGKFSIHEPLDEVIERLIIPYIHASISHPTKKRLVITETK